MREVVASAPGKVNLQLRAGTPREDGYHPLFTVFEAISLREYVVARTRRQPGITVETLVYRPSSTGDDPLFAADLTEAMALLPSDQHLAVRAARALQPLAAASPGWGASSAGIHLTVHKTIPAAGGMAGGSADAAAALVALNKLWELGLSRDQLTAVGRTLGADVPACLLGAQSVGIDRGDQLSTLPADSQEHWWALAFCKRGLSTPAVFHEFDRLCLGAGDLPTQLRDLSMIQGGAKDLAAVLCNDLAEAALSLRPGLADIGESAMAAGAAAWMVSGSGPTIAALADDEATARQICEAWAEAAARAHLDPNLEAIDGTAVVSGPTAGARVDEAFPAWVRAEMSRFRAK